MAVAESWGRPAHQTRPLWEGWHPPADPPVSFAGKVVVITGCNTGVGLEAAIKYAQKGCAHLVLGVRTQQKGAATKTAILSRAPGFQSDAISIFTFEGADPSSVRAFAAAVAAAHPRVDVLALNAGVFPTAFRAEAAGYEATLMVNYLGTALLGVLMLPVLGAGGRVVVTGSTAHLEIPAARMPAGDVLGFYNDAARFGWLTQYRVSKLLVQWAAESLARRLAGNGPTVVVCCPGMTRSDILRGASWPVRVALRTGVWALGRTTEQGARTLVSAAALGAEAQGGFWKNDTLNEECGTLERGRYEKLRNEEWEVLVGVLTEWAPEVEGILASLESS